ncbi:RNA polymerase sigma factor [Sinomicrobium sp. M5D2P9]
MSREHHISYRQINGLRAGDATAFRNVFTLLHPRLIAFVKPYTRCDDDARDIVQNVFEKVWLKRQNIVHGTFVKEVFAIARETAQQHLCYHMHYTGHF